jgi:hypothetical protein
MMFQSLLLGRLERRLRDVAIAAISLLSLATFFGWAKGLRPGATALWVLNQVGVDQPLWLTQVVCA